ncbi:hypothetical protein [Actinomadura chokoriensis]|uniref:hypothetical protein n=1 Tax=Actinomadura chokoriensis TaxID=454156 RepID=UPI0031F80E86
MNDAIYDPVAYLAALRREFPEFGIIADPKATGLDGRPRKRRLHHRDGRHLPSATSPGDIPASMSGTSG